MKTTLNIDDTIMERLIAESARQGKTVSELVEAALRVFLEATRQTALRLPELPAFDGGGAMVDITDRQSLYGA